MADAQSTSKNKLTSRSRTSKRILTFQAVALGLASLAVIGVVGSTYVMRSISTETRSQAAGRSDQELAQRGGRGEKDRDRDGGGRGNQDGRTPRPSASPRTSPSTAPTGTPQASPTATPGGNPTGGGGGNPIQPYAGAPKCADSVHNPTEWHGIWNYELGCHYDHEHKMNPHDLDSVFGTDVYSWSGGQSISYPWQTYAGADRYFERYAPGTCTENTCKHEGYKWLYFKDRNSADQIRGALLLGTHAITDARVQFHALGGEMDALTRVHSVWVEARSCYQGQVSEETCGIYKGGGWINMGRLNYPERGIYQPLPGDPPSFADTPAEAEPYRIHPTGKNSLDSWQSEGNKDNYLSTDPSGLFRMRVGFGVHFNQGESVGETNPMNAGIATSARETHYWCLDPVTNKFTCDNNNSSAALFRTWVSIPYSLDGSVYDEDKTKNGYFTFHGYTNRYGDIVDNCSNVGLDCVPAVAENFPIGGCQNSEGICKSAYRGTVEQDTYEADISPPGEWWIEYPN